MWMLNGTLDQNIISLMHLVYCHPGFGKQWTNSPALPLKKLYRTRRLLQIFYFIELYRFNIYASRKLMMPNGPMNHQYLIFLGC